MRARVFASVLPVLVMVGCAPAATGGAETTMTEAARVVRVVDGDTIRATWDGAEKKIRVLGINAPEVAHPDYGKPAGEPCGKEATQLTKRLVDGKTVRLIADKGSDQHDKYGRTLAYIDVAGTDVGAELLKAGLAEHYRSAKGIDRYQRYAQLAAAAEKPACANA